MDNYYDYNINYPNYQQNYYQQNDQMNPQLYQSTSQYYTNPLYSSYPAYSSLQGPRPDPNIKVKCKKACFPFIPKTSSPCTCNFNSYKSPNERQQESFNSYSQLRSSTPNDGNSYDFLKGFLNPTYEQSSKYSNQNSIPIDKSFGFNQKQSKFSKSRKSPCIFLCFFYLI